MRRHICPLTHVLLIETTGMREQCLHRRLLHHEVLIAIEVTTVMWTGMCQSMLPKWNRGTTIITKTMVTTYQNTLTTTCRSIRRDEELTFATEMCHIAIQKADVMERQSGKCFNCKEFGHYWWDCPKPLREEFQRLPRPS